MDVGDAFSNPKVEASRRFLARYQPFIITIIAITLIAVFLPGRNTADPETASDLATDVADPELGADETIEDPSGQGPTTTGPVAGPADRAPVKADPKVLTFEEARKRGVALVANCDLRTGRIKIPSKTAPPCTQKFNGVNGGKSWQGVDAKTIKAVYFLAAENPAAQAILASADADDSDAEVMQQVREWGQYFAAHYNLWGRKVVWEFVKSTAPGSAPDDDRAARADSLSVISKKPFIVINSPANIFVDNLVAKKILCMCTVSMPIERYIKWYPYVWTTLMASTQGYIHRAQYVARLKGKKAQWAGDENDPTRQQNFKSRTRKFGFIWYDTDDNAYASGAAFFVRHLREKYGISLCKECVTEYHGYPRVERTQEEAPGIIQRMKAAGVTSIIFSGDPFGPIFFTKEAQQQFYGPEWILTGSALTDTSFFAGLYVDEQWRHAFGISYLSARVPEEFSGSYRLYRWHFNKEPTARASYGLIYAPVSIMYAGIHQGGPVLNPSTFAKGLENLGVQCRGCVTSTAFSFGNNGLWPWKIDPAAADDATEIWWDSEARGENEIGQQQTGLYRYVAGGKRYMPGTWPMTNPFVFNKRGTVTIYDKPPPQDQWPCYPSPATKKMDRC